jgi:hypothetical protein
MANLTESFVRFGTRTRRRSIGAPLATELFGPRIGPQELELISHADWSYFPPRLPEQPFFYPVLNEEYANQIARDWNVKASGAGLLPDSPSGRIT